MSIKSMSSYIDNQLVLTCFLNRNMIESYTKKRKSKEKIYERNPMTGVIRWRYIDESPDKFGWPNYGRILKTNGRKRTR